jgi:hypothetical protein
MGWLLGDMPIIATIQVALSRFFFLGHFFFHVAKYFSNDSQSIRVIVSLSLVIASNFPSLSQR